MEEQMRSKFLKVVLGCGFAVALAAPALACDFHAISTESEQATEQSTTPNTPQTAQSQPAPDTGSN
jgi:hypothetical protein